jgi:hypothetical protein
MHPKWLASGQQLASGPRALLLAVDCCWPVDSRGGVLLLLAALLLLLADSVQQGWGALRAWDELHGARDMRGRACRHTWSGLMLSHACRVAWVARGVGGVADQLVASVEGGRSALGLPELRGRGHPQRGVQVGTPQHTQRAVALQP